jgi:transcriptional regulator GlxA family with amidase domain
MLIQVLLYDGFDELDAIGPYEILHGAGLPTEYAVLAGDAGSGSARSRNAGELGTITASHGTVIVPPARLAAAPDLLLVPGGGWRTRNETGTWGEYIRGVIPAAIAERHAAGSTVASVCTGAMLLAKAGILEGRPAVTHWAALDDLRADGADVREDARVVDDGDVLTAGGVTSGLDLALHLVERYKDADAARFAARLLEHDPVGKVLTRA